MFIELATKFETIGTVERFCAQPFTLGTGILDNIPPAVALVPITQDFSVYLRELPAVSGELLPHTGEISPSRVGHGHPVHPHGLANPIGQVLTFCPRFPRSGTTD